ncbi:MAG: type II toxin-antitoxin system prevent-host-death family antitoxin [Bifidobacteriaceae bacterium]|jgi:prevent-host-death family protein|nr:type II toxin-antitoxin system prevent-host-death family antitoxin [Bifidobacteriaceae bacterium]
MTSRDFNQRTNEAKSAAGSGPVIITDRGQPSHVLLSYMDYLRLRGEGRSVAQALAPPAHLASTLSESDDSLFARSKDHPRAVDL